MPRAGSNCPADLKISRKIILDDVFGLAVVVQNAQRYAQHQAVVAIKENGQRVALALLHPKHDCLVIRG